MKSTASPLLGGSATAGASNYRVVLSDAPINASDSQPLFLFQADGDARLRGITWDGQQAGLLTRSGPFGIITQSPDGRYVVINGEVMDRHGQALGAFPWQEKDMTATWSPDSALMCKVPDLGATGDGAPLRLEVAAVGQAPRVVARGFGTFGDQSAYPVLACDPKGDRAVVGQFSQGFMPSQAWVIRMSSGTVLRTFTGAKTPLAATQDGSLLLISIPGSSKTTLQSLDGSLLATINGFEARGYSGDLSLVVGQGPGRSTVVLNARTGQRVWSSNAGYFGYVPEPNGPHLVVGVGGPNGFVGDAFLIGPEGVLKQFPPGIAAGWKS